VVTTHEPCRLTSATGISSTRRAITPYNAQVFEIQQCLPGARVGTVDKFQGQEAPIAIYSTATSSHADARRGMEFLFSLNRVATSRAKCVSILVGSPQVFEAECRTPRQMQLANAFCRYLEMAELLSAKADVTRTREDRVREGGKAEATKEYISEHPVVRVHPETGRKALYINIGHTVRFKDMTEAESTPLLNFLFEHQTKPEFTCRFNWRVGSLAFWDNRCTIHNPVNDYHGFRRVMHRLTLAGDRPR
jgi:hypothetical protein